MKTYTGRESAAFPALAARRHHVQLSQMGVIADAVQNPTLSSPEQQWNHADGPRSDETLTES